MEVHGLPLREEVARDFALLTRTARAPAHASERDVELETRGLLVHFDNLDAHAAREVEGLAEVAREDGRGPAVRRVVRKRDGLA